MAMALLLAGCNGDQFGEVCVSRERGERRELPPEFSRYAQAIEESKLEFIRIDAQKEAGTEPWASKFRGIPYLPEGASYTVDPHGLPLTLLAQLSFDADDGVPDPSRGPPEAGLLEGGLLL
jgi:uncharacterized protein YwqG